jgi:hypothetical protein
MAHGTRWDLRAIKTCDSPCKCLLRTLAVIKAHLQCLCLVRDQHVHLEQIISSAWPSPTALLLQVECRDAGDPAGWITERELTFILMMEVLDNCPHDRIYRDPSTGQWQQMHVIETQVGNMQQAIHCIHPCFASRKLVVHAVVSMLCSTHDSRGCRAHQHY